MTPAQENELLRTIRLLKKEVSELKEIVTPVAPNKNKFIGVKEACAILNCSRWTLYRRIKDNAIPCTKKGDRLLFSEYELIKYIQS